MRRTLVVAAAALGALCAGPAAAVAHPLLVQAAPTPGLVAASSPAEIQLQFSEPTVRAGSSIVLLDQRGRRVSTGTTVAGDGGRTLSIAPARKLPSAIYRVRWSALGADGHAVGGTFAFAVAGPKGPPPGAQRLVGQAGAGGSGSQSAPGEGVLAVIVRWLGLLAASVLAGGFALVRILRRRLGGAEGEAAARRWWGVARLAVPALVLAAAGGVVAAVTTGASGTDLGLLTGSPTGQVELARAVVVVVLVAVLLVARRARDVVLASGGLLVLGSYALAGHVLGVSQHRGLAEVDQVVHVVAAGVWLGGVVTLLAVCWRSAVPVGAAARAFAPLAAGALGVAAVTGVLAAIREVDRWYFLRWSDYGRVIIAKTVVVALAALAGLVTTLRARRGRAGCSRRLLAGESGLVLAVLALAATLAGLAQGRGQQLPAQRGTLLPGPALATVLSDRGPAQLVLAPARPGTNTLSVALPSAQRGARRALVKLGCPCAARPLYVALARPRGGGAWTARTQLPAAGTWSASLTVDGRTAPSPVSLPVGVPSAAGAPPVEVLSIADLSGPDAQRCADHVLGLTLGIGRINAAGGLDGGRKVAALVLDDGGSAARAQALAVQAIRAEHPIALAAPCGRAASTAVAAASAAGLPSVVSDPAVGPVAARRDFRLAGDPYAEGFATGQYVRTSVARAAPPGVRTVLGVDGGDAQAARRLRGERAALAGARLRLEVVPVARVERAGKPELERLLDRRRTLTMLLDGPSPEALDAALRRLGGGQPGFPPAPILASARVMSERFVENAGSLGRLGVIQGTAEVTPDSRDALGYAQAVPALYPGRRPSLDGLRGYLAGLALRQGVRGGTAPAAIARDLLRPPPFTDALGSPWRDDAPDAGSQRFELLGPNFLPSTLIPTSAGGESFNGSFFTDGAWQRLSTDLYGPPLTLPLPPLA